MLKLLMMLSGENKFYESVMNMVNSLVSIIVPVYKVEKYLEKCVMSVIEQSYNNIEIILVDDGSPDNSPVICDRLESEFENILVIHKDNGGLSEARNFGINASKGDYLFFLDSDDTINNEYVIEDMVRKINESNADLLIPDRYIQINEASGSIIEKNILVIGVIRQIQLLMLLMS